MITYIMGGLVVGALIGTIVERYRWLYLAKNSKLKEVDGDLYKVIKIRPKFKTDGDAK